MELHRAEKREEGDRGEQEEKRGNQRREIDLGSVLFPKCSIPSIRRQNASGRLWAKAPMVGGGAGFVV